MTGAGHWNLSYAGPALPGAHKPTSLVAQGRSLAPGTNWTTLTMQAVKDEVGASLNGQELFKSQKVRDVDTGQPQAVQVPGARICGDRCQRLVPDRVSGLQCGEGRLLGAAQPLFSFKGAANGTAMQPQWAHRGGWRMCRVPLCMGGSSLGALAVLPAAAHKLRTPGGQGSSTRQDFVPVPQLRALWSWTPATCPLGTCCNRVGARLQALSPTLSGDATRKEQLFVNDYTLIRNSLQAMTAQAVPLGCTMSGSPRGPRSQPLAGNLTGEAFVGRWADWKQWSYFPRPGCT